MSNATEYLTYQEIRKRIKDEHGPHHVWLRRIQFSKIRYDTAKIDLWLLENGFKFRIKKRGDFLAYSWVDVDDFPFQPADSWVQDIGKGIFFQWAIVPEGELTVAVPYSHA